MAFGLDCGACHGWKQQDEAPRQAKATPPLAVYGRNGHLPPMHLRRN